MYACVGEAEAGGGGGRRGSMGAINSLPPSFVGFRDSVWWRGMRTRTRPNTRTQRYAILREGAREHFSFSLFSLLVSSLVASHSFTPWQRARGRTKTSAVDARRAVSSPLLFIF